ncbi:nitrous oxide reductase family maturation protein NosD [Skermanella rosea]|uniref:nitrous oxide reductase family maturation protein NosD n=1 Tax=Skermanella rosea TaxID=1817965 RepID=UPI001E310C9D|nr:nitrous oxide reductase family maturation protein NosD [Skermanella rosea]UEM03445.1 nitrous oxide reductase family maturation protein NosD [Skermanella rosea]
MPAGGDLQTAVAEAAEGDVLVLRPGIHAGPVRLDKRITLQGMPGAVVEGNSTGSVVTIQAAGTVVSGLEVRGSGRDLQAMDAGIFIERTATRSVIEANRLENNLYGVYLHGAVGSEVRHNLITGLRDVRTAEAGNGISVWNAPDAKVVGNRIRYGRDGIYVVTSRRNLFQGNWFEGVRFAVHYMYTNDSEVSGNVSVGSHAALAIMFSDRLRVLDNWSIGSRDHGLLFNAANNSRIEGNVVLGRRTQGPAGLSEGEADDGVHVPQGGSDLAIAGDATGKCVFIYNANRNAFRGNWFEDCAIGVHFTAGSERNQLSGNAFVNNRTQVKYVGTRSLDWSVEGRGNYWSDNAAFDLSGDGIADEAYRPNDIIDRIVWTYPAAKLLLNSPGIQVIRWAQKQFPALTPGGVVDTRPLIRPPTPRPVMPEPPEELSLSLQSAKAG